MPNEQEIENQRALLAAHRRTLSIHLNQLALRGGEGYTPPEVINGIAEARANIRRIKQTLRGWGIKVADDPNDEKTLYEPDSTLPPYHPVSPSSPQDFDYGAFAKGGCIAKLLMIVGVMVILAGVITWFTIIFSFMGSVGPGMRPERFSSLIVPWGPVAFGLIIIGAVIYGTGRLTVYTGISRNRLAGSSCTTVVVILLLLLLVIGFLYFNKNIFMVQPTPSKIESVGLDTTLTPQGFAEILSAGLTVRGGPSTNYPPIAYLTKGDIVPIFNVDPNTHWLEVQLPTGKIGWISDAPDYVLIRSSATP
jgi:hypothetical protein